MSNIVNRIDTVAELISSVYHARYTDNFVIVTYHFISKLMEHGTITICNDAGVLDCIQSQIDGSCDIMEFMNCLVDHGYVTKTYYDTFTTTEKLTQYMAVSLL